MEYRELGQTGWKVSAIGLSTRTIDDGQRHAQDRELLLAFQRALDGGVNFFEAIDMSGRAPLLGQLRRTRREPIYIATRFCAPANTGLPTPLHSGVAAFVEGSLRSLGVETLDLLQLHYPYIAAHRAEVFGLLDDLVKQGKIRCYGICVDHIDEARQALKFPNAQSVQMVFNIFRQRPAEGFFSEVQGHRVGLIARAPLASRWWMDDTNLPYDDQHAFNGQAVDSETGRRVVEALRPLAPPRATLAQFTLRWILMFTAVSCALLDAERLAQAEEDLCVADWLPLTYTTMARIREIYNHHIRVQVDHDERG